MRIFLFLLCFILLPKCFAGDIPEKYFTHLNMCELAVYHFDPANTKFYVYSKIESLNKDSQLDIQYSRVEGVMEKIGSNKFHLSSNENITADVDFSRPDKIHIINDTGEAFLTPCDSNQAKSLIQQTNQWLKNKNSPSHNFATN